MYIHISYIYIYMCPARPCDRPGAARAWANKAPTNIYIHIYVYNSTYV